MFQPEGGATAIYKQRPKRRVRTLDFTSAFTTPAKDVAFIAVEFAARLDGASATKPIYPHWHQQGFAERNPFPV
jgi:hypothetical protein